MMNRQQADALRRENEARNSAQWQKTQASFAASNQRAQQQHQASQQAASTAAHNARMAEYAKGGEALRGYTDSGNRNSSREHSGYSSNGSAGKSKGGGLLFVLIVIGAIAAFGHSGSGTSGPTSTQPVALDNSRSELTDNGASFTPTPDPTNQGQLTTPETNKREAIDPPVANAVEPVLPSASTNNDDPTPSSPIGSPDAEPLASLPALPPPLEPLYRVGATFPASALQARPNGPVTVVVGVQPDGSVASVIPESGDSLLVPAAISAARQWRFKPYTFEPGKPVRSLRISFEFASPTNGFYPQQSGRGFVPATPGRGFDPH